MSRRPTPSELGYELLPKKAKYKSEPAPDEDLLKNWFDVELLKYMFESTQMCMWDTTVRYNKANIRITSAFTANERKRFTRNIYDIYRDDGIQNKDAPVIRSKTFNKMINELKITKERALGGRPICKARLIKLVRNFNKILANKAKSISHQKVYLYSTMTARCKLIAQWVNWYFKVKYRIDAKYNHEQIRKLIEPSVLS